jgi:GTP-binding protein Era
MVGELVREKILNLTNDEVPHSVTCVTTYMKDKGNIVDIYVDIIIDRDSLKKIIIGAGGTMLKNIGTMARRDIEDLLGKQVYLELYVKTIKNWRDKEKYLADLGFKDFDK